MIELGCCAFSFGYLPLDDALALVSRLGFRRADVGAGQVGQADAASHPARVGARLTAAADRAELTLDEFFVCAIDVDGVAVRPSEPDDALRAAALDRFRGLCACAAAAGFRSIMGIPGTPQDGTDPDRVWATAASTLRQMVAIASDHGIQLHVEPHAASIVSRPAAALQLAAEVPGLLYTLDYAHHMGLRIPQEDVAQLHAVTGHLHAKPARPGYAKCFAHHNTIDFAAIIADLSRRDWTGTVALECIGHLDPRTGRPTCTEIPADVTARAITGDPPDDLMAHPVAQTMRLTYDLVSCV